ncbi:hypothetical protein GGS24DRAFT_499753 [Hypoxylon argillaceum]|nr:hypothetical protein GGS24DRAFT_499753 [Hypoxylon argillaceum]
MVYQKPRKGTKRGPKAFSGSRRTRCDLRVPPVKPLVRHQRSHPRDEKTKILLWLINNRIAIYKMSPRAELHLARASAYRKGRVPLTHEDRQTLRQAFDDNGVIYRPPMFKEAAIYWNVKKGSVSTWWTDREKYLSPEDFDRSNKLPGCEVAPGAGIPKSAPRAQVLLETPTPTDVADSADTHDNDESDAAEPSPPPPPLNDAEMSDDSDIELDDDDNDDDDDGGLSEPSIQPPQSRPNSSDGGQDFQDAPEYPQSEGALETDESDEDADYEPIEEIDTYGTV